MAILLKVDAIPYETIPVHFTLPGKKRPLIIGRKIVTDEQERMHLRDEWLLLQEHPEVEKARKALDEAIVAADEDTSRLDKEALMEEMKKALMQKEADIISFLCKFVVYIQDASLQGIDEVTGQEKTIAVPDTRTVQPFESLWESAEECLVVLLDVYLQYSPFRDSFFNEFSQTIFSSSDLVKAKIKN